MIPNELDRSSGASYPVEPRRSFLTIADLPIVIGWQICEPAFCQRVACSIDQQRDTAIHQKDRRLHARFGFRPVAATAGLRFDDVL
jgi:hypothetical protein